jgi:hypothetical protein
MAATPPATTWDSEARLGGLPVDPLDAVAARHAAATVAKKAAATVDPLQASVTSFMDPLKSKGPMVPAYVAQFADGYARLLATLRSSFPDDPAGIDAQARFLAYHSDAARALLMPTVAPTLASDGILAVDGDVACKSIEDLVRVWCNKALQTLPAYVLGEISGLEMASHYCPVSGPGLLAKLNFFGKYADPSMDDGSRKSLFSYAYGLFRTAMLADHRDAGDCVLRNAPLGVPPLIGKLALKTLVDLDRQGRLPTTKDAWAQLVLAIPSIASAIKNGTLPPKPAGQTATAAAIVDNSMVLVDAFRDAFRAVSYDDFKAFLGGMQWLLYALRDPNQRVSLDAKNTFIVSVLQEIVRIASNPPESDDPDTLKQYVIEKLLVVLQSTFVEFQKLPADEAAALMNWATDALTNHVGMANAALELMESDQTVMPMASSWMPLLSATLQGMRQTTPDSAGTSIFDQIGRDPAAADLAAGVGDDVPAGLDTDRMARVFGRLGIS